MIDIEEFDGGFRVVDAAKNEVEIEIDDWEPGGEELEIGYDVTETITGSGTEIRLPNGGFLVESSEFDDPRIINMNEKVSVTAGNHLFRLDAGIDVFVKICDSTVVTAGNSKQGVDIVFSAPTRLTLGFREYEKSTGERICVQPSLEGAISALNVCTSRHYTETPDRSFPSERPLLPSIEIGDGTELDEPVRTDPVSPISIRIPRSLDYLFPVAPLAFYVGAEVTAERRSKPVLDLDFHEYELTSGSRFPEEIATLLRRVFYLDCLVREAGPRRLGIKEFALLDDTPLDPASTYSRSMADRVKEYLEFPFEVIESSLPDWPLATFVEPTVENLSAIPFLADRLSMVYPPKSSPVDRQTWVERSLGNFYRSTSSETNADMPIEIISPEVSKTHVQGWIAPGNPVDAFKYPPEAFKNQCEYLAPSSEPISIKVILNDDAMNVERSKVVQTYQDRSEDLSLKLNVLTETTREELATAFESPCDFLHYIGHCDPPGFRCVDGNLSAEDLTECRARTFFLNACGSYSEGLELVHKGSVAGAVTFGDVIDAQAAKVGSNFARLFMFGYTIERALYHARGQAIMNRQYAVVGDGTHVLTQGESIQPAIAQIRTRSDGKYSVRLEAAPVNLNGAVLLAYINSTPNLLGNHKETVIDDEELEELIPSSKDPLIFDGKFYWPEELLDELF